jgi:penicillin-binding protein 1A
MSSDTDYSRRGVVEKQHAIKSVPKRLASKLWIMIFRVFIIAIVLVGVVGVMGAFGAFKGMIDSAPEVHLDVLSDTGYSSTAYFTDGTVSQVFAGIEANRRYAEIEEIPILIQHCFVALEDERFYEHSGIDARGILRAAVSVVEEGGTFGFGASTITQQLLKNQVFSGGGEKNKIDKLTRKVQEQFLAVQLETVLTKDEILEYYLNFVNLGNGAYGVAKAAESYFGKDMSELTLSEASVLAPIVLSPTNRNPITHPDMNAERRQSCLDNMLEMGWCTKEQYDEAIADDVYTRIAAYNMEKKATSATTFSYFTDELVEQVCADMQEKLGYSYDQAQQQLYYGGLTIYTTQDREVQEIVDRYYTDEANFPEFGFSSSAGSCYELTYALSVYKADGTVTHYQRHHFIDYFKDFVDSNGLYYHEDGTKKGISELTLSPDDVYAKIDEFRNSLVDEAAGDKYVESKYLTPQPQSSFSIIDQKTGHVVAICGGRGAKTQSLTLNRASNTTRSVGSTFKVLASFLPALDSGGLTLASVQDDTQYFYPGTTKEVINWYSTGFRGLQSIRTGIYNSLNIVAVKTLEQIGASLGFEYLEKLGFSTLVKYAVNDDGTVYSDVNLAIALGGLTKGVTNVELCAAYASIANGGVYNKPMYYTKILDHDGNVLLTNETESTQVMKTSTAWLLTDAMHDTITKGTGSRLGFKNYEMHVAGKTGTASKNNDLWFVGYTPYYTAAVWTGFDNNFDQYNKTYQQEIWRKVMEEIHTTKQLPDADWEKPDSIVTAAICTKCGNLAVAGLCDQAEGGDCVKTEYFAKGTVPTQKCTCHVRVNICRTSGKTATENCPLSEVDSKVLLVKDEIFMYNSSKARGGTMELLDPPVICETWDTPYIYHPDDICDIHLPDGAYIDEEGNIVYPDGGGEPADNGAAEPDTGEGE